MPFRFAVLLAVSMAPQDVRGCPEMRPVAIHVPAAVPLDSKTLEAAKQEAAWILRSLCVEVAWAAAERDAGLLVRILERPLTADTTADALGMAMPGLRRGAIFLRRVEGRIEMYGGRIGLATLLGSVLAHEIGHLLLGTSGHSRNGIMRADFGKAEIERAAQRRLVFTEADRAALVRPGVRGTTGMRLTFPLPARLTP